MTVGYLDGHTLVAILSPGPADDRAAAVWAAFDAACTHQMAEIEVPSAIGQLDRVAWIWALNSLSLVMFNPEMHTAAIDLAWLGAPTQVAVHVAAAELAGR